MALDGIRVGGAVLDAVTGIKHLFCRIIANNFSTFETELGTDYVVPGGAVFYITRVYVYASAADHAPHLNHADTGVQDAAAGGTNSLQISGRFTVAVANVPADLPVLIAIPAGKYIELHDDNPTCVAFIEGYEV